MLYQTVRDYITSLYDQGAIHSENKIIYDLYCGTGTIAQILAPIADKVIGVEIVEEAVVAARENAKKNHLENCEFIAGDVLKVLDNIEEKPDLIVLDPPRDGINPKALKKIIAYGVEHMIYVSCKSTSLVRDLKTLQENGYYVTGAYYNQVCAYCGRFFSSYGKKGRKYCCHDCYIMDRFWSEGDKDRVVAKSPDRKTIKIAL